MTRIALDLSRREIRVAAITERGEAELTLALRREGSARIAPAVTRLLDLLSVTPREVREIVVTRGPGSFTGLRVGFAFAAGIARAAGATVRAVPLPEAVALHHAKRLPRTGEARIGVALDAGRGEAYAATVRLSDGRMGGTCAPVSIVPCAELAGLFATADLVLADPSIPLPSALRADPIDLPPRSLFEAARIVEEAFGPQPHTPLYVRKSAAREKREASAC